MSAPNSNLLYIHRNPAYNESLYYDAYHNFIYSNKLYNSKPEMIEIQNTATLLQLRFVEASPDFQFESMSDLSITYDQHHRILTYDLETTYLTNKHMYSNKISITNTYALNAFISEQNTYSYVEFIGDGPFDVPITHHSFLPEEASKKTTTSIKNVISTGHHEYIITIEDPYSIDTAYLFHTHEDDKDTITDNTWMHTIIISEDEIEVYHRYEPEPYDRLETKYITFDGLLLLKKEFKQDYRRTISSLRNMQIYHLGHKDTIHIENRKSPNELLNIHKTDFGYVVDYFNSESDDIHQGYLYRIYPYGHDWGVGYLDYYHHLFPDRPSFILDSHQVIFPNTPLFWL